MGVVPGKRVEFSYGLVRTDAWQPEARVHHIVELVGPTSSQVQASYSLEGEERLIYYTGPAADIERLAEELERQTDEIFAAAVERLRQKLSEALSRDQPSTLWLDGVSPLHAVILDPRRLGRLANKRRRFLLWSGRRSVSFMR